MICFREMFRSTRARRAILALFGIDLAVFLFSWVPTMCGYVGSESFELFSLSAGLVSLVAGMILLPLVALVLLGRREDPR